MKNLELQGVESQSDHQATNQNGGADVIDFERAFATLDSRSFELFEAQFSDVTCLSTLTARGFASADLAFESDIHSFDISGVNTAGVIPAGSWSSPRIDNFATDLNAHGVFSIDGFNSLPTNGDFLQGIGDGYSFIKDLNFGMNEEQVCAAHDESAPRDHNEISLNSLRSDSLNHERENNHRNYSRVEPHSSWAESNEIIHTHIFSQQSGLEGSQA